MNPQFHDQSGFTIGGTGLGGTGLGGTGLGGLGLSGRSGGFGLSGLTGGLGLSGRSGGLGLSGRKSCFKDVAGLRMSGNQKNAGLRICRKWKYGQIIPAWKSL